MPPMIARYVEMGVNLLKFLLRIVGSAFAESGLFLRHGFGLLLLMLICMVGIVWGRCAPNEPANSFS